MVGGRDDRTWEESKRERIRLEEPGQVIHTRTAFGEGTEKSPRLQPVTLTEGTLGREVLCLLAVMKF